MGSSSRSTSGWFTSARARATRCFWPPESCHVRRRGHLLEVQHLEGLAHAPGHLRVGEPPGPQAEGDVLEDREVGEQGVVLEDGVDGPPVGGQPRDVRAAEQDLAVVGDLEARDDAQQRGLAASRGTENRHELAGGHGERHSVECRHRAEALDDPVGRELEPRGVPYAALDGERVAARGRSLVERQDGRGSGQVVCPFQLRQYPLAIESTPGRKIGSPRASALYAQREKKCKRNFERARGGRGGPCHSFRPVSLMRW